MRLFSPAKQPFRHFCFTAPVPRAFTEDQKSVFEFRRNETPWFVGRDWIDLYKLLGVKSDAHPREIDDAIVGRSAECLQFAFSRRAGSEYIALLEKHLPDFRRVLLHEKQRLRYDELLDAHLLGQPAPTYAEFLETVPADTSAAGCLTFIAWLAFGAIAAAHFWGAVARA